MLYDNELCGEIVMISAFIMLPMCITMITNTVLNSMNCEKRTLVYYFFGAAAMLVSIFALTMFIGVYSYLIGLSLSFVITAVLNLLLLRKKCEGIKFIKYTLHSLIVIVAACAFGIMLDGIISAYVSPIFQIIICAPACLAFTAAFLYCLEMFTMRPFKKLISKS